MRTSFAILSSKFVQSQIVSKQCSNRIKTTVYTEKAHHNQTVIKSFSLLIKDSCFVYRHRNWDRIEELSYMTLWPFPFGR